jgi:hypothetical protein
VSVAGSAAGAPATVTASTTAPPAAASLDAVLAKVNARADYGAEAPRAEPAKPKVVEIKGDAATLSRVSKLERENLDYKAKIATLETGAKDVETLVQVRKLYSEGKKVDAIALLAGADPTAEMEALLIAHLDRPHDPETEGALAAKVEDLAKRIDADEKARKIADDAAAARHEAQAMDNTLAFATHALDTATNEDGSPKFELCARADNKADAAKLAIEHAGTLAVARGIDPAALTPDVARKLLQDAYADVELELEAEGVEREKELAARFRRTPKTVPARAAPDATVQPTAQQVGPPNSGEDKGRQDGQQTSRPQPLSKPRLATETPKPAHTIEAVLAKNRERARYG